MNSRYIEKEKVILVGIILNRNSEENFDSLTELERLAETAGGEVVSKVVQERKYIDPAYFIGKGKAEFIRQMILIEDADKVIFDEDLSPAQVKNLEKIIKKKVIDRSTLILDIFAYHARTKEAKTQVELAQLQYLLPRLPRRWTHLERQAGGIGLRGPGETQLETDRRLIKDRIKKLEKELEKIETQRQTQRKSRSNFFRASLIGYTNSGKSTLMNALTPAQVSVDDKLFETLDSTVRKLHLNEKEKILLSDTVGFIKKLPHQLVASFKSTLEVVKEADLLLHIVDVSHKNYREHIDTVNSVLNELDIRDKSIITVFNKIDLLKDETRLLNIRQEYKDSVFISAKLEIGINKLKDKVKEHFSGNFYDGEIFLPYELSKNIGKICKLCNIMNISKKKEGLKIKYRVKKQYKDELIKNLKTILAADLIV